jgi:hypothetical protein
MSPASVPTELGALRDLPIDLVRISVGFDQRGDLEQAFAASSVVLDATANDDATEVA